MKVSALLEALPKVGVRRRLVSFVLPLGYSFNLDGSMLYCTFGTMFIMQAHGVHLSVSQQIFMLLLLMVTLFREPLGQAMGPGLGTFVLIVSAIGATSWMQAARIVRGDVLGLKEREFILAARSIGTPNLRMMTRHILPNVLSPIMVAATLGIATAIITESALSFLGLGFPPDFPTWGRLLYDAIEQMQMYPWRVILPGVFISLTVLTVNYIGDGLRDAMDPRIRGR